MRVLSMKVAKCWNKCSKIFGIGITSPRKGSIVTSAILDLSARRGHRSARCEINEISELDG